LNKSVSDLRHDDSDVLLDSEGAGVQLEFESTETNLLFGQRRSKETTDVERGDLDEVR